MSKWKTIGALGFATVLTPAAAQTTYRYEFDQDLVEPNDVAVYNPCPYGPEYVFVADPGAGALLRFDGTGSSNSGASASAPTLDGPYGVAVDDSPSSPRFGQVYTVEYDDTGWALLKIYADTDLGTPTCVAVVWEEDETEYDLDKPVGVAVGPDGSVYIADAERNRVVKVAYWDLNYLGAASTQVDAVLAFDTLWSAPSDVSVDLAGRIHVPHPCGCLAVFHPDGTLFGTGSIWAGVCIGVDAKDDHGSSRTVSPPDVRTYSWDIPDEDFELAESYGAGATSDPRGLEFEKYERTLIDSVRCEDRVFVADGSAGRVVVFGEDFFSTPRPYGAVAHWRFDTDGVTTPDSVGSNDMALGTGTYPLQTDGRVRCGMYFNFDVGEGTVADSPDLDFGTGDFSIETWIRTDIDSYYSFFLDKSDSVNGYSAFLVDGHLGVQLVSGGVAESFAPMVPGTFVADGVWHHVVITVQRSYPSFERTILYIDGSPKAVDTSPLLGDLDNDWDLIVGRNADSSSSFRGSMDELVIYDRAVGVAEIVKQYKAGCAGKHDSISTYSYCTAGVSTAGCIPGIDFVGEPDFQHPDGFQIIATGVDEGALGYLLYSLAGPSSTPMHGGVLCVETPAQRTRLTKAVGSGPCGGVLSMDFNTWMASGFDTNILPGASVWAQYWYREATTSNPPGLQRVPSVLTDALHFRVL